MAKKTTVRRSGIRKIELVPEIKFSKREKEVLQYLSMGFKSKRIAQLLGLNQKTIATYKIRSVIKLGLQKHSNDYLIVKTAQLKNIIQ